MFLQRSSSNFTTATIVSQNTDGWQSNWASSYLNIITGTPNQLRVRGTAPEIVRTFTNVQANDEHNLTYTQTQNNAVQLVVEQSANGTTWSTLLTANSANGTHTQTFTPTASYLRVRYSASSSFQVSEVILNGVDETMVVNVTPGGFAKYRYSFQGQEHDDEIKGKGNSVNYTYRMYDPRLGRMLTIDPLSYKFPFYSPYHFCSNSPIISIDMEGLQSTVRLTYGENTIEISRNSNGQFEIEFNYLKQNWPSDLHRPGDGNAFFYQDLRPGGMMTVRHKTGKNQQETYSRIVIPLSATILKDEEIQEIMIQQNLSTSGIEIDPNPTEIQTGTSPLILSDKVKSVPPKEPIQKLLPKQKDKLSANLTDGTIFAPTASSGATSLMYMIPSGNYTGTIQNMMSPYKKYDLSNARVTISLVVGTANKNEIYYPKKGDDLVKGIINELVKAGFKRSNIKSTITEDNKKYGPGATFKIQ